jgi:hypothetical protein
MEFLRRFALWATCAALVIAVDIVTKVAPHREVVTNYSHAPAALYLAIGAFLLTVGVVHSPLVSAGAGLMFGALCGNAGQLMIAGFATDWIEIGGWFTNVADIAGGAGLLVCVVGFILPLIRSPRRR